MGSQKKILVLCGGKFALQSLQLLGYEKFLVGIGIGKGATAITDSLESECEESSIAFMSFIDAKSMRHMRSWLDHVRPDYIFSISFPFLIPEEALAYGVEKFINFHPGPLPSYRGPMPIFEVLRNQEKETAICAHFMSSEFDRGAIIFNDPVAISEGETYGSLAVKLSERTATVALNMANMLEFATQIPSRPQDESRSRYYEKPLLVDTYVNWKRMEATEIIALINACNPWNMGADAVLLNEQVKIINASAAPSMHQLPPGTILSFTETLNIACEEGMQLKIELLCTDAGIMTAEKYAMLKKIPKESLSQSGQI